jgi:RimJ/RimL family protein N-acetyltransferase
VAAGVPEAAGRAAARGAEPGQEVLTVEAEPVGTSRLIDPAVSWCNWVIQLRDPRCLAGTVQATIASGPSLTAEVAWVVGSPWQGQGIATEAARALVGWLAQRRVRAIMAYIHPGHVASAAVAAAAGLRPTDHWQDGERRWELVLPPQERQEGSPSYE